MGRIFFSLCLAAGLVSSVSPEAASVTRKFSLIENERVAPGSKVVIGKDELNAYVRSEIRSVVPDGVREPRLELGENRATGFAYIDFPKLRAAEGEPMGWFASRLLAGERPVRVEALIRSGGGVATVDVERVEINGISISGRALDFLIRNFLWSYYPEAKVGKPFELAHRIDRLEVQPGQVNVVIGR
jgi:hypothetical protein